MTSQEFDEAMDKHKLDDEFAVYLMNHSNARIYNGDSLIRAMESGDYYDDFKDYFIGEEA